MRFVCLLYCNYNTIYLHLNPFSVQWEIEHVSFYNTQTSVNPVRAVRMLPDSEPLWVLVNLWHEQWGFRGQSSPCTREQFYIVFVLGMAVAK